MNMSLDVTIFGFSRSQFLMIELKHQKERKKMPEKSPLGVAWLEKA